MNNVHKPVEKITKLQRLVRPEVMAAYRPTLCPFRNVFLLIFLDSPFLRFDLYV